MSMLPRRFLALAALLGLFAGCTHRPASPPREAAKLAAEAALTAETPPPATRRSAPGTPFTRSRPDEPFNPALVVTTHPGHGDLFLVFAPVSPSGPILPNTARLHRGQTAFILPYARNYGLDSASRTDLTFETAIYRPDGERDGDILSSVLWQDGAPSPHRTLHPAAIIGFYAEPQDPLGTYRVVVRVHDHLAEETKEFIHEIELVDYAPPLLPEDFDPNQWFHAYYLRPEPELALPALGRFFEQLLPARRPSALPPLLGFYDQILRDNAWLLPHFAARLEAAPPDEAFALSLVLGFHLRASAEAPPELSAELWARLADFRGHDWPADPDQPLRLPAQLDTLWGRFFGGARHEPVRRLIEPLAHTDAIGASERWRLSLPPSAPDQPPAIPDLEDPATPAEVRREVLLRTALWSLRTNARQHPLVRAYLEQSLRTGELAPGARLLLERSLRDDSRLNVGASAPRP